jgi:transcriptional regulator with XRE-family HTH domain
LATEWRNQRAEADERQREAQVTAANRNLDALEADRLDRLLADRLASDELRRAAVTEIRHARLCTALARIGGVTSADQIAEDERVSKIAREVDVSRRTVDQWLERKTVPGFENLARIVDLSGFSADYLLGADDCAPERNAAALEQMHAVVAYTCRYLMPGLHPRVRDELSVEGEPLMVLFRRVFEEYADRRHLKEAERDRVAQADDDDRSRFLARLAADAVQARHYPEPVRTAAIMAVAAARERVERRIDALVAVQADYVMARRDTGALAADAKRSQRTLDRLERTIREDAPMPVLRNAPTRDTTL